MPTVKEQLLKMKLAELKKMASELGVKVAQRDTKKRLAAKIIKKQAELHIKQQLDQDLPGQDGGDLPEQPGFESAASQNNAKSPENDSGTTVKDTNHPGDRANSEPKSDGRGGFRDNAGRTPGQTDEKARTERILNMKAPDPNIVFVISAIFGGAAITTGIQELALSKEEAADWGLSLTKANELWHIFDLTPGMIIALDLCRSTGMLIYNKAIAVKNRGNTDGNDGTSDQVSPGEKGQREKGQGGQPAKRPVQSIVLRHDGP